MSREIKFRAWDKENNKMWFTGQEGEEAGECTYRGIWSFHSYFNKQGCFEAIIIRSFCNGVGYEDEIVKLPIMQYTGLKNNNDGTELYEGDIFESHLWEGEPYEIVFKDHAFKARDIRKKIVHDSDLYFTLDDLLSGCAGDTFKVIGNIYENPELLEGEK